MKKSERKQQKQNEAKNREEIHNKLTLSQKIKKALSRRGESKKEIDKLTKQ